MDHFRGLFAKLDKDNNGFISVEELHNEMKKSGILPTAKVKNIIDGYDQDKDGRLDYNEFVRYMMDREKKWKIHFHDLDKNKCGLIDQEDIICLFKELGVMISQPNAKRIIQIMDRDNSMTVDWGEFLQHVILNPADNIGELVSSWKNSLVFDVGESRPLSLEFPEELSGSGMWRRFVLAAGLADAMSRTITAPIDRLKTQLQVHGSKTFAQAFEKQRAGGLRSMWQGNAVNVLKGTPQSTLQCMIYAQRLLFARRAKIDWKQGFIKPKHNENGITWNLVSWGESQGLEGPGALFWLVEMKIYTQERTKGSLSVQQRFGLGCVSGAVTHAVFYPLEVLKVRLNLQHSGTYKGMVEGARSIYRNESLSSFYRGFKPSLLCMIPYAGVECAVHQSIVNWAKNDPSYNSDSQLFFFSFVAFASGQVTSYPLAVIRTQQQAQAFCAVSHPVSSVLEGFTGIYARHGLRGYYNGMGASFIRAVPCALLNYTLTRKFEVLFDSTWS